MTGGERAREAASARAGSPERRPRVVAGYEVLRRLGSGNRSEVLLGLGGRQNAAERAPLRALKVIGDGVDESSVDVEIDALASVDSPHVVRLHDLGRSPEGRPCLVLDALQGARFRSGLDELAPAPGEAVTVLASVLAGLESLHTAGFAHGSVRSDRILVDGHGCPVLIGLGHGTRASDLSSRKRFAEARGRDLADFAALARGLVLGTGGVRLVEELRRLAHSDPDDFFPRAEALVFGWAEPEPLGSTSSAGGGPNADGRAEYMRLRRGSIHDTPLRPARAALGEEYLRDDGLPGEWDRVAEETRRQASAGVREAGVADPSLELLRSGFAGLRDDVVDRVRRMPRRRRRLVATALGFAVVVATAAAIVLRPPGEEAAAIDLEPAPPSMGAVPPENPDDSATDREAEPLSALTALLAAAREGSVRAADYGRTQRLGDFAILTAAADATTSPPPILLERTDGGWVLRGIFADRTDGS